MTLVSTEGYIALNYMTASMEGSENGITELLYLLYCQLSGGTEEKQKTSG